MAYLVVGGQVMLAAVFVVAAASKLRRRSGWAGFVGWLRQLDLLPGRVVPAVAVVIVGVELLAAGALLVPATRVAGLALAGSFLVVATGAALLAWWRGIRVPCRCFGSGSAPVGPRTALRNLPLLAVAGVAAAGALDDRTAHLAPVHPGGLAVAVAGGLVAAVVVTTLDDIVDLFTGAGRAPAGSPEGSQR